MSLLYRLVFSFRCSSSHHKLAIDALRHLRGPAAENWQNLFLARHEHYLQGAKAPDEVFKDFKNHVLHVGENYWGGAAAAADQWYRQAVESFRDEQWPEAIYSAGVLSHYYTDPIQPFHTGQTEEEGKIHRAAEWSIAKSYDDLQRLLENELGGYPEIEPPRGRDWLKQMVCQGADASHPDYVSLLEHYNLARGVADPPAGLDDFLRRRIARLIGHATVGFARILERLFDEADVNPPLVSVALPTVIAAMKIPVQWIQKKIADQDERAQLMAMYEEAQRTGKVVENLPDDDREVRRLHAREVLRVPLKTLDAQPAKPTGKLFGSTAARAKRDANKSEVSVRPPAPPKAPVPPPKTPPVVERPPAKTPSVRPAASPVPPVAKAPEPSTVKSETAELHFFLHPHSAIVDAPSIGPKTAQRLEAVGIRTVADLLSARAEDLAARLGQGWITAAVVAQWQAQAVLACRVPEIRGHDAQILVACGIREPEQLARQSPQNLLTQVEAFAATKEGERVLRSGAAPDLAEVAGWISAAARARPLRAA